MPAANEDTHPFCQQIKPAILCHCHGNICLDLQNARVFMAGVRVGLDMMQALDLADQGGRHGILEIEQKISALDQGAFTCSPPLR